MTQTELVLEKMATETKQRAQALVRTALEHHGDPAWTKLLIAVVHSRGCTEFPLAVHDALAELILRDRPC